MDTNVKKFRYSPVFKLICVLLSFACFAGSAFIVLNGFATVEIRSKRSSDADKAASSWVETTAFRSYLNENVNDILLTVSNNQRVKDCQKKLADSKEKCVTEIVNENLKYNSTIPTLEEYKKQYGYDNDDVYDDGDYWTEEYNAQYYEAYHEYSVQLTNNAEHAFGYHYQSINDAEKLKEYFSNEYDAFARDLVEQMKFDIRQVDNTAAHYYASFNKEKLTNLEEGTEFSEAQALNADFCVIYENGRVKACKNIPQDIADTVASWNDDYYFKSTYFCIYFNAGEIAVPTVFDFFNSNNKLEVIKYTFDQTQQIYDNIYRYAVVAVVLLILSFIFAFMYFTFTGRKNDGEPARLIFTDYVPFELQLGIIGGIGFGLSVLGVNLTEGCYAYCYSLLYAYVTLVVVLACWIMLFCVCASVGRYSHSGKKFYKHLLVYWILFALYKSLVFIFKHTGKFIARVLRKAKSSVKKTVSILSYKPRKMKKSLIALACTYIASNIGLIYIDALIFFRESIVLSTIIMLLILAGNFFVIRWVAGYIKNLDTIIASSQNHEDSGLATDTLAPSLQILNDSLRYTNTELQNAITKAVKDERLRTELITNVSHDLKTPLTSIINYVDLLSRCEIEDEDAKEYITVLIEKSARLKRLIEDLIEASKISSGNITVNLAPLNLSELCLQSTIDVQSDFEKAGLELVIKQGNQPETVVADGAKTYRVLENLLSNAKKYSAKASRVYVSVYGEADKGVIEIKNVSAKPLDISADELTERFVRGDASRTEEGNGLGLSIATELCRAMNGELEIIIDGDLFKARVKMPKKQ